MLSTNKLGSFFPQEARNLILMVEGMTGKEIDTSSGQSHKTAKNYLSNVLEKLGLWHELAN